MRIIEAINILKPASGNIAEIKIAYRLYTKTYHPDVNSDGEEMMKLGNLAYEVLMKNIEYVSAEFAKLYEEATESPNIAVEIQEIFTKIKHFPGLEIEVCGTWLWVSGNTYTVKGELKNLGFQWASKKKMWSWHLDTYKKYDKNGEWDINKIRNAWGSMDMETELLRAVA